MLSLIASTLWCEISLGNKGAWEKVWKQLSCAQSVRAASAFLKILSKTINELNKPLEARETTGIVILCASPKWYINVTKLALRK